MPWYYANNDQRLGPVSDTEFARLARDKIIHDETLVWQHGMPDWKTYAEVAPKLPTSELNPPPIPGMPERAGPSISDVETILAARPVRLNYAGFWVRAAAKIVDSLLLSTIIAIVSKSMGIWVELPPISSLEQLFQFINHMSSDELLQLVARMEAMGRVGLVVGLVYNWFFLKRFSATPGKMILGLSVVRSDGSQLSHGRIVARYFAEMLNRFTLFIGYVIAAFDDEKRAMHDYFCDTRVIKKQRNEGQRKDP